MRLTGSQDGMGRDRAACASQGHTVFQTERVVRTIQDTGGSKGRFRPSKGFHARRRPGEPTLQESLKFRLKIRRFLEKKRGHLRKCLIVPGFAAKPKLVNSTGSLKNRDGAGGKTTGTSGCGGQGQFDDSVGTRRERHRRSCIFVVNGGDTSLDKVSAHDDENIAGTGKLSHLIEKIPVSVVERIKFSDDCSGSVHDFLPPLFADEYKHKRKSSPCKWSATTHLAPCFTKLNVVY